MISEGKPLRWGIIGCGKISTDFCIALLGLPKSEHSVTHVAARDGRRAEEFAGKFGAGKHSDRYTDVFEDPDVDVCYIGTLNPTHADLSISAMKHGKHVLCEKPATMNSQQLEEVLTCAKQCNVFFMEAVWTRCFPLYRGITKMLSDNDGGGLGEVNAVLGTFGIGGLFNVERVKNIEMGGGVLIDIGIYLLTVADMIFGGDRRVVDVNISGHVNDVTGLDRSGNITILYEGNKMASLVYSGDHDLPNEMKIICTQGTVDVHKPFWCPETYTVCVGGETPAVKEMKLPEPSAPMNFMNSMGLMHEAEHVRACLVEGLKESSLVSHDTSKRICAWMDKLRGQLRK